MNVLAVHYGHNATVGLSVDGRIVRLLSEERISRHKNHTGFPRKALAYIIEHDLGGSPDNVDCVVVADRLTTGYSFIKKDEQREGDAPFIHNQYFREQRPQPDGSTHLFIEEFDLPEPSDEMLANCANGIAERIGCDAKKVWLIDHHAAHALSAVHFGVDDALIFTLDGEGDGLCASVNLCKDGRMEVLSRTHRNNSLGLLYAEITGYLGMRQNEHEFKVMGLAPYAAPEHRKRVAGKFAQYIMLEDGQFKANRAKRMFAKSVVLDMLYERFDHVAGGLQEYLEEITSAWVRYWVEKMGVRSVALAGGVFMNIRAAQRIGEMDCVDKLFVVPSAGDESLPIGGCYWGAVQSGVKPQPVTSLALGREFDDAYVGRMIERDGLAERYSILRMDKVRPDEMVARLIENGHIVARCTGREEWGARALGNRSILASAEDLAVTGVLNRAIKNRDFWMPFAPAIQRGCEGIYLDNPKGFESPYMALSFNSTSYARNAIPAALHQADFTTRPQIADNDSGLTGILNSLSGHRAIINTSFNLHGEPNVGSPEDAVATVDRSGLIYLVMGSYLLEKK